MRRPTVLLRALIACALAVALPVRLLAGPDDEHVERWTAPPEIVVVMTVLQYDPGAGAEFVATSEQISDDEATAMTTDLLEALALFTGDSVAPRPVTREVVQPGAVVRTWRTGQIVVARYRGLRDALHSIGLGGRMTRATGAIRAGSVMLDADYDRVDAKRRLLRTHELGHALGFNHVTSRTSIMNPRIGPEPTEEDRLAARLAATTPLTRAAALTQESANRITSLLPEPEN